MAILNICILLYVILPPVGIHKEKFLVNLKYTICLIDIGVSLIFNFIMQLTNINLRNKEEPPPWMVPSEEPSVTTPEEGLAGSVEDSEKISAAEKSLLQKVIRKGLVENHHDLEVQRKDPNSPLYSVKTFEALNL